MNVTRSLPERQGRTGATRGYVYVLSNVSMPGIVKIGRSVHGGRGRADTFYNNDTAVPTPFVLEFELLVLNAPEIERDMHTEFAPERLNSDREFFRLDAELAAQRLLELAMWERGHWLEPRPEHDYVPISYPLRDVRPLTAAYRESGAGALTRQQFHDALVQLSFEPEALVAAHRRHERERSLSRADRALEGQSLDPVFESVVGALHDGGEA